MRNSQHDIFAAQNCTRPSPLSAALQPVCHAFGALEQADPPSLHDPASDRAPPVKPFVKSSASPLPLSLSLPASADWTYSHGIMRTAENIQGDSHVYEPTLLSRLRDDFSGSPPQHEIHKVKGRGWEPLLEVQLQRGIVACFKKFPPPCIIHPRQHQCGYTWILCTTNRNKLGGWLRGRHHK